MRTRRSYNHNHPKTKIYANLKRTSNRSTPRGAQEGCNWILMVPVLPGSPPTLSTSMVTIFPDLASVAVIPSGSDAPASCNRSNFVAVDTPIPVKTALFNRSKAVRRRIACNAVPLPPPPPPPPVPPLLPLVAPRPSPLHDDDDDAYDEEEEEMNGDFVRNGNESRVDDDDTLRWMNAAVVVEDDLGRTNACAVVCSIIVIVVIIIRTQKWASCFVMVLLLVFVVGETDDSVPYAVIKWGSTVTVIRMGWQMCIAIFL